MVIGWIIVRTYSSGFTDFLVVNDQTLEWTSHCRQSTVFRDQTRAQHVLDQLKQDDRIELVPVEAHC